MAFLQVGDAFINHGAVFGGVFRTHGSREGIGILHLFPDVVLVVVGAELAIGTERKRPVDDADPVVRLGIIGAKIDVFLMVGLGFLELLGIIGLASHLENDGADAIDGTDIVGVDGQNFLEFIYRLIAEANVLLGGRAGNVLAGIGGSEVKARVHQAWVKVLGLLEVLDGRVVLAILEGRDTFVKKVAGFELAAARTASNENNKCDEGGEPASEAQERRPCRSHTVSWCGRSWGRA